MNRYMDALTPKYRNNPAAIQRAQDVMDEYDALVQEDFIPAGYSEDELLDIYTQNMERLSDKNMEDYLQNGPKCRTSEQPVTLDALLANNGALKQDITNEYNRIMNEGNDPLLMYILQKHAQKGFTEGPIGSDGYFEQYDPELNPELEEDYQQFLNINYPNRK